MDRVSEDNISQQMCLNKELDGLLEKEQILWAQKSRLNWMALGERNTKFFHLFTRARRAFNMINCFYDGSQLAVWVGESFKPFLSGFLLTI